MSAEQCLCFLFSSARQPALLQVAIGKERLLEGFTLEAGRQARILVVKHVVIHTYGVVVVHIALFHHLVGASQNFHDATTVPGIRYEYEETRGG